MNTAIGKSIYRKDAWDKVTGKAQYADDIPKAGALCARLLTSTYAHARIVKIDTSRAMTVKGVKSVLTGNACKNLFGPLLEDRPALAQTVVRYAGEPVAMVVAIDEPTAEKAVRLIQVQYEELPVVLTPSEALAEGAPLIHQQVTGYKKVLKDIYPEEGSNIASRYRVRKGDSAAALSHCDVIIQQKYYLPPSDHLPMEVRVSTAEISADGVVSITTSSQSPYAVREHISKSFLIPSGKVQVKVPFVGGAFGGKAPVTLEILAYLASRSVGGKKVRVTIPREQDMASAPCRLGLEADITLGADRQGIIKVAEINYLLDCGAYADISPYMTKALAVDCTGPYRIENLSCDAVCVYTNHTYVTSFRGFSHEALTFCMERTMDMLARECKMDPLTIRMQNAILPGDLTPTQVPCTSSLIGNLPLCLEGVKELAEWNGGNPVPIKPNTVNVKGIACFWKTENPPTNAISGATVTFNPDGSVNLITGVVEIGAGGQTHLAQILAEKLQMDSGRVHVVMDVDTRVAPEHWKTVASLTEYMAGNAVERAADDLIAQLKQNGSLAFSCKPEEIEVAHGRVYSIKNPEHFIEFKDIVQGYKAPNGASLGEPVLGRGGFMLKGLSMLNTQTGEGQTGPDWSLGAQVVEVEADLRTYTYRIISASTVMDVGRVINPEHMRSMVAGGMAMGVSLASREAFTYDKKGIPQAPNLRTYKLLHIGQEPDYRVGFVETPEEGSPYGVRSYSEHGVIGIAAALGNALSAAFDTEILTQPITPEKIWRLKKEDAV